MVKRGFFRSSLFCYLTTKSHKPLSLELGEAKNGDDPDKLGFAPKISYSKTITIIPLIPLLGDEF
jgi:hypothetical protein